MSSTSGKCSICGKSLGKSSKSEITTACNHTFHRKCAEQQLIDAKSNDRPICHKTSALEHAIMKTTMSTSKQHDSAQSKSTKNVGLLFLMTRSKK